MLDVTPHDAHSCNTIGEKQREILGICPVNVHIPQAGNQELAGSVDQSGIVRRPDGGAFADFADTPVGDDDSHVPLGRSAGGVDNGDVGKDQRRLNLTGWFLCNCRPQQQRQES